MDQTYIKEILEALRGKTIIDKITLSYELSIPEGVLNKLPPNLDADINTVDTHIDLVFQPRFLTYVQWLYFSVVEQIQQITGKAKTLDIYAHQLFEDMKNTFALRFNENYLILKTEEILKIHYFWIFRDTANIIEFITR